MISMPIIRRITLSAMFLALGLIFDRVLMIPIGEVNRIAFGSAPVILSSFIVGPIFGMMVGAMVDVIGFMLNSVGTYTPFVTFGYMALGAFPYLIFYGLKRVRNTKLSYVISYVLLTALLVFAINFVYSRDVFQYTMGFNDQGAPIRVDVDVTTVFFRVFLPFLATLVFFGLSTFLYAFQKKLAYHESASLPNIKELTFIVLVVDILISIVWGVQWRVWYFNIPQTSATTAVFYFIQIAFFIIGFPVKTAIVIYGLKTYLRVAKHV
jgi:ECF transporter S component (folate family)